MKKSNKKLWQRDEAWNVNEEHIKLLDIEEETRKNFDYPVPQSSLDQ